MNNMRVWMAAMVAVCAAGCADGGGALSSVTGPSSNLSALAPAAPSSCAVPGSPRDISATVTGPVVSLAWSPVSDASDYVILVGTTPTGSDTMLTNSSDTRHTVDGLEPGTYFARVHAHNWCGAGLSSETLSFTID